MRPDVLLRIQQRKGPRAFARGPEFEAASSGQSGYRSLLIMNESEPAFERGEERL
jgi:hypothetical protein